MTAAPTRVVMVSNWAVNPYQKLLVAELEKRGLSVSEQQPGASPWSFRERPHVIHLQNVRPFLTSRGPLVSLARIALFALPLLMARGQGTRIVWTAHDLTNPNGRHPFIDRVATVVLAQLAHAIVVHDDVAATRIDGRNVHVIPHGSYAGYYPDTITRADARAALNMAEDDVVFLLFGWIRRYKGVMELIRAFKRVHVHGARLVIAGRPSGEGLEDEIRAAAADDPRIVLELRTIPDDAVQLYMHAGDVAVFPYSRVLSSGAVVLAKSFGKACIVASESGVDEEGAFLYDPNDERALTRALERAAGERGLLEEMGKANRARSVEQHWGSVAEATLRLYA